jgi:hypothetical protein
VKRCVCVPFLSFIIFYSGFTVASDTEVKPRFTQAATKVDLHELITQYRPRLQGSVDIVLFRKLSFTGDVMALPQRRKSGYVNRLINNFSKGESLAPVAQGIELMSSEGASLNVYVVEALVPMIQQNLVVGDRVSVSAYHAYTSDYGPGLIMYAYERHLPLAWSAKFMLWIDEFMNTSSKNEGRTLIPAGGT